MHQNQINFMLYIWEVAKKDGTSDSLTEEGLKKLLILYNNAVPVAQAVVELNN